MSLRCETRLQIHCNLRLEGTHPLFQLLIIHILTMNAIRSVRSPISSAMALNGQVWLVELVWRNFGLSY